MIINLTNANCNQQLQQEQREWQQYNISNSRQEKKMWQSNQVRATSATNQQQLQQFTTEIVHSNIDIGIFLKLKRFICTV